MLSKSNRNRKDLENKRLLITRRFNVPLEKYGVPGQKANSSTNGGRPGPGRRKQNHSTSAMAAAGSIARWVRKVNGIGAGPISRTSMRLLPMAG